MLTNLFIVRFFLVLLLLFFHYMANNLTIINTFGAKLPTIKFLIYTFYAEFAPSSIGWVAFVHCTLLTDRCQLQSDALAHTSRTSRICTMPFWRLSGRCNIHSSNATHLFLTLWFRHILGNTTFHMNMVDWTSALQLKWKPPRQLNDITFAGNLLLVSVFVLNWFSFVWVVRLRFFFLLRDFVWVFCLSFCTHKYTYMPRSLIEL